MLLIDQLRALQTAELDALGRGDVPFGGVALSLGLPSGLTGGLAVEGEIAALLQDASDADLDAAIQEARKGDEAWTSRHLAAEVERRRTDA